MLSYWLNMDRITFGFLFVFIFCVPWEEEVTIGSGVAMSHYVGAVTAGLAVIVCAGKGRVRKVSALHGLLAFLVLWSALSYYWSVAPDLTAVRIGSYVQLLLMVWLIWEFAPTDGRQVALLAAYVLGTYVSAVSTIRAFVTGTGDNIGLSQGRFTAPGFNENELGVILALGLVMSGYLLARNTRPRMIWLLSVPVSILAICLTGSRGSLISAGVAILIFPLTFRTLRPAQKKLCFAGLAFVPLTLAALPSATWSRIGSISGEIREGSLTNRTYIWAAGMDVFRDHPVVGVGAGAFGASVYDKLDIPYVAHNTYLSFLVETGVVGEIIFAALFASLVYTALGLEPMERRAWILQLLTWGVAVLSLTWEHRKPTWFLFGMLIARAGLERSRGPVALKHAAYRQHARQLPEERAAIAM